jgi:hypothetical protein
MASLTAVDPSAYCSKRSAPRAGGKHRERAADIVAVLWPDRCKALVSGQGYLIINYAANRQPLPPRDELALWFQYYFCTERVLWVMRTTGTPSTNSCGSGSLQNANLRQIPTQDL